MLGRLAAQLKKIAGSTVGKEKVKREFLKRLGKGSLTRDENPLTYFCVYFAA